MLDEEKEGCLSFLITGFIGMAGITILAVVHGCVLFKLWRWFIVPTFGVSALGLVEAIGLNLVLSFLMSSSSSSFPKFDEEEDTTSPIIKFMWSLLGMPLFYLILGYIFSQFIN